MQGADLRRDPTYFAARLPSDWEPAVADLVVLSVTTKDESHLRGN